MPPAPANSVSVFRPNGKPISPDTGFTAGGIDYPAGHDVRPRRKHLDRQLRADSVTVYPKGRPGKAIEIPIPPPAGSTDPLNPPMKPFGIAIDHQGNAWVTGSRNDTLAVIGPDGKVLEVIPREGPDGRIVLRRPMGNASDSRGNIWVATRTSWTFRARPAKRRFLPPQKPPRSRSSSSTPVASRTSAQRSPAAA